MTVDNLEYVATAAIKQLCKLAERQSTAGITAGAANKSHAEVQELKGEIEQIKHQRDRFVKERDEALEERDSEARETSTLLRRIDDERDEARRERDELQQALDLCTTSDAVAERDALQLQLNLAYGRCDRHREQVKALEASIARLSTECYEMAALKEKLDDAIRGRAKAELALSRKREEDEKLIGDFLDWHGRDY